MQLEVTGFGAINQVLPLPLQMDWPAAVQVAEVIAALQAQYPGATTILRQCAYAVADQMVNDQHWLDNDTLVLLAPVSGG